MKLSILNISKEEIGKQELPSQFNEDVRPDLIKRAVISIQVCTWNSWRKKSSPTKS